VLGKADEMKASWVASRVNVRLTAPGSKGAEGSTESSAAAPSGAVAGAGSVGDSCAKTETGVNEGKTSEAQSARAKSERKGHLAEDGIRRHRVRFKVFSFWLCSMVMR
jgi:hypothetical protein